jgi:hypothetical protein
MRGSLKRGSPLLLLFRQPPTQEPFRYCIFNNEIPAMGIPELQKRWSESEEY